MTSMGNSGWTTVYFSILNWDQGNLVLERLESLIDLFHRYLDRFEWFQGLMSLVMDG